MTDPKLTPATREEIVHTIHPRVRKRDELPGWPTVLHEDWAAAYLSLSPGTFRKQVAPLVPPVRLTIKRIGWLRTDLDAWLATRRGASDDAPDASISWDDV